MFGFLYRSIVGSVINLARGRLPMKKLFANWVAAVKLPFMYLGLTKDIWLDFDRYLELEAGRPSTFFFVPKENYPGRTRNGNAPPARGTRYEVSHVAGKIPRLMAAGCEIGLHGIDAWLESSKGREEAGRISDVSAKPVAGVRMHWLYTDEKSAGALDEAGFSYDSTVGYNNTFGFRAGTAQVFKPFQASRLLELPMHIMDTALFYPHYLDLSETEAWERLTHLFDDVLHYGGALTVNWHDRSIAPERLWGDFYVRMINELTARGAWFSTAEQAVSWFRRRRSATFEKVADENGRLRIRVASEEGAANLPGFRLRFHPPQTWSVPGSMDTSVPQRYTDTVFAGGIDFQFPN
jgi:peptidoglycan/xylan/chitin deacetylase (PgdA/CDA1 family)